MPGSTARTAGPPTPTPDWPRYFPEIADHAVVAAHWSEVLREGLQLPGVPPVEDFLEHLATTRGQTSAAGDPAGPASAAAGDPAGAAIGDAEQPLPGAEWLAAHVTPLLTPFSAALARLSVLDPDHDITATRRQALVDIAGNLGIRVIVTELAAARAAGELSGPSPEARYEAFLARLPGHASRLVAAYPLMFRLIWHRAQAHLRFVEDLLTHTQRHWAQIAEAIPGVAVSNRIRHLHTDAGDGHAGGRSVAILTLDSGVRLVVKPRSLAVDQAYATVVAELGAAVGHHLPTPASWTAGRYGWTEFVSEPQRPVEVAAYLDRLGMLVGLLYLLNANDMHFENLVVHPDGSPVVIDLESLLRPRLPVVVDGSPVGHALRHIDDSVLGLGVLPTILTRSGDQFDVGVLGYDPGQISPTRSYELVNAGRDDMTIAFTHGVVRSGTRNISLTASGLPVTAVREAIVAGFTRVTDWALSDPEALAELLTAAFAGARVRYIHQPTMFYGQLLRIMTHPSFLSSPQHRHMIAQRVRTRRPDFPAELHRSEARQLFVGDIPLFEADADGRWLLDDHGRPVLELAEAPLATALARIRQLTPALVAEQVRLLRLSFVPKLSRDDESTPCRWQAWPTTRPAPAGRGTPSHLDTVARLAGGLVDTMIDGDPGSRQPPTWVAPLVTTDESGIWSPGALGYDLYAGVPGLGLFLAAAAAATGDERSATAARSVLLRHATLLDPRTFDYTDVSAGVGQGVAGALTAALHGGLLVGDDQVVAAAWAALPGIEAVVGQDHVYDYVTGSAGALAVSLDFHRRAGSDPQRATARRCAAAAADRLRRWWDSITPLTPQTQVFTGFAHGLAGMAPYLADFARLTGDVEADRVAGEMVAALGRLRSAVDRDWGLGSHLPDDRAYAWCHGAPGIALGLALSAAHGVDVDPSAVDHAVELTRRHGLGNNVTACHGDLGSLEILTQVGRLRGDERLVAGARHIFDRLHDEVLVAHLDRTDTRLAFTTSAFLGSAAIGLAICRRHDPRVPSLLSLR